MYKDNNIMKGNCMIELWFLYVEGYDLFLRKYIMFYILSKGKLSKGKVSLFL